MKSLLAAIRRCSTGNVIIDCLIAWSWLLIRIASIEVASHWTIEMPSAILGAMCAPACFFYLKLGSGTNNKLSVFNMNIFCVK